MTTFDGSTHRILTGDGASSPAHARPEELGDNFTVDTLDLLRGQLAAQQTEESRPTVVDVPPGGGIRLMCSTSIESAQTTRWNKKALRPELRKSAQVSPLDINQFVFNSSILVDTCERIEVSRNGEWVPITDTDGNVLTFKDQPVLRAFGVVDAAAAIKKLFPRDPDLIRAGQDVLRGAGWGDRDGDDAGDPS